MTGTIFTVRTTPDSPWRGRGPRIVDNVELAQRRWERAVERGYVEVGSKSECWPWLRACLRGYGILHWNKVDGQSRHGYAHVIAYVAHTGQLVPDDLVLDHLCGNRWCTNPSHLDVTTTRQNTLRSATTLAARQARRPTCKRGHDLTDPANLVQRYVDVGKRRCLTCQRLVQNEFTALLAEAKDASGMTQKEYAAAYGMSRAAALRVLGRTS